MSSTIAVECRRCGHEREVTRDQIRRGSWRSVPCPACGGATGLFPLECDAGHVSVAPMDAIVSGDVPSCPVCYPLPEREPSNVTLLPPRDLFANASRDDTGPEAA